MKRPAEFITELSTRLRRTDGRHVLADPLIFYSALAGTSIIVPRDFDTDFASVPRLPFAYLLFGGVADEAAVVHDWIYSTRMFPRKMCDEIFAEAMKACGLAAWRRGPMWFGVRLFGKSRY